jgi:hypothetical protein
MHVGETSKPLTPALSHKGRGSSLALATAFLLPLREKDRMRGFVSRSNEFGY